MWHLLNLHPDCYLTNEIMWLTALRWAFNPPCGTGHCEVKFRQSYGDNEETEWLIYRSPVDEDAAEDLVEELCWAYRHCHPSGHHLLFGDKHPEYNFYWRDLRAALPDSRIVVINRPIPDCVNSGVRKWGNEPRPIDDILLDKETTWREDFEASCVLSVASIKECPDTCWVELDELNVNPREHFERVLEYVGLDASTYPWPKLHERFGPNAEMIN